VPRCLQYLELEVPHVQGPVPQEEVGFGDPVVIAGEFLEVGEVCGAHGDHGGLGEEQGSLHVVRVCMGDDDQVHGPGVYAQGVEPLFHMAEEVAVAGIDEDALARVDEVGVAVVLPVVLPQEGMESVKDLHYHCASPFFSFWYLFG
jgi:hypothetical protein